MASGSLPNKRLQLSPVTPLSESGGGTGDAESGCRLGVAGQHSALDQVFDVVGEGEHTGHSGRLPVMPRGDVSLRLGGKRHPIPNRHTDHVICPFGIRPRVGQA